jgi:uncharacterized Tic20 family protein
MAKKTVVVDQEADGPILEAAAEVAAERGEGREKTLATVTHVLGLLTLFLGPLVMYFLFKRKASPWLRNHLDEAINYHILLVAAFIVVVVGLAFLSQNNTVVMVLILVLLLLFTVHLVFGLIAILWAARGKSYHFPLDVKIVR